MSREQKIEYALELLSSLEEIREENLVCDFTIKAGNESFLVHRTVLVASSKYFRGMFRSQMIEETKGYITTPSIEANIMRICIRFMYTGDADLTAAVVVRVLQAAHLMELQSLIKACLKYLQDNITTENCISVIATGRLYEKQEIEEMAEKYLQENLGDVSLTESFSSISKDELIRYASPAKVDHKDVWQAVLAWVSQKEDNHGQVLIGLLEEIKFKNFPFQFLFEKISTEDLLKNSKAAKDCVLTAMFSNMEQARSNLTVANIFALKKLVQASYLAERDQVIEMIKEFMLEKFADLIEEKEFVNLDEDDILMFLRSSEVENSSKKLKLIEVQKQKDVTSSEELRLKDAPEQNDVTSPEEQNLKDVQEQNDVTSSEELKLKDVLERQDVTMDMEFLHLEEDDNVPKKKGFPESLKWKAILKWTKHERRRKKLFSMFFKFIQLDQFSTEFIQNNIRVEPMVTESAECMNLLLQATYDKTKNKTTDVKTKQIAMLSWKNAGGLLTLFDAKEHCFITLDTFEETEMEIRSWDNKFVIANCNEEIYVLIEKNLFKLNQNNLKTNNKWQRLKSLPQKPEFWPKMATFQGKIFILIGGAVMGYYQPANNSWTMDIPGCGLDPTFCFMSSPKGLFAIGGRKSGSPTNEVKKYAGGIWSNIPAMLQKRSSASAAVYLRLMVVAGGYDGRQMLNTVECYHHLTRSWSKLQAMNSCHSALTLINISDKLYACGGDMEQGGGWKDKGTVEVYDEDDEEWKIAVEKEFLATYIPACEYV